ncbi:MAG: glycoside hydrolase family protein [Opitutaceae bacterium]|nr:glycoside hydrolase family protein [Opitutaceae bacterium]
MKPHFLLLAFLFAAQCLAQSGGPPTDTLDFTGRLSAIAPQNIFRDPGYYVWCGTGIRGEDGKYYLFYSRWKAGSEGRAPGDETLFKDMAGWIKYCEIAVAVSDAPTGPYQSLGAVLRGTGNPARWDQFNAHNPHVKRFNGRVYLYFIATRPVEHPTRWMTYANGQRIGVASASSVRDLIAGRFTRSAEPLIAPDNKNNFARAVNPGVTQGRDGRYLMMFKAVSAPTGGHMSHWVATADKPDGPFSLIGPALTEARFNAEDPYFWYDRARDRYYAIVKDMSRKERVLSPQWGALALVTSEKGWGDWQLAAHPLVSLREYTDTAGQKHSLGNLERPQLLFDDAGNPICLLAAASKPDRSTPTFNVQFAIHSNAPRENSGRPAKRK